MNEEVLKSYEEIKRNRDIINAIEPDFFFEIVDCLLKENKELKSLIAHKNEYIKKLEKDLFENASNYVIPKQKIKGKIEELDIAILECEYLDDDDEEYKKAVEKDKLCLLNQKRALQELLEGGQS